MSLPWSPATWAALALWVLLVVVVASLIATRRAVRKARFLREQQTRPFVVVDVEPGFNLYLAIENTGPTVARNVRIRFVPLLVSARDDVDLGEIPALGAGIPTMAPGQKLRFFLDVAAERLARPALPHRHRVEVEYERADGRALPVERYDLDLRSAISSSQREPTLADLIRAVVTMRNEMHKWTDGVRGLRIIDRTAERGAWEESCRARREAQREGPDGRSLEPAQYIPA